MNGDRTLASNHSLEWLEALDAGRRKDEARHILRLVQAVASIFDNNQFQEAQQKLIDLL